MGKSHNRNTHSCTIICMCAHVQVQKKQTPFTNTAFIAQWQVTPLSLVTNEQHQKCGQIRRTHSCKHTHTRTLNISHSWKQTLTYSHIQEESPIRAAHTGQRKCRPQQVADAALPIPLAATVFGCVCQFIATQSLVDEQVGFICASNAHKYLHVH